MWGTRACSDSAQHYRGRGSIQALFIALLESLSRDIFCYGCQLEITILELHIISTTMPHIHDFLSNTSTHAHWLQCRNSDFQALYLLVRTVYSDIPASILSLRSWFLSSWYWKALWVTDALHVSGPCQGSWRGFQHPVAVE